jgi:hypothetical protein
MSRTSSLLNAVSSIVDNELVILGARSGRFQEHEVGLFVHDGQGKV